MLAEQTLMLYHKINSIFKRDPVTNKFIFGEYAVPEHEFLKDNLWEFVEKVDGTNMRIVFDGESVVIGGRSNNANLNANLVKKINAHYTVERLKELFPDAHDVNPLYLCGEGYGAGIQKGSYYIPNDVDFILFDVWFGNMWLERKNVIDIANKLGIKYVQTYQVDTLDNYLKTYAEKPVPSFLYNGPAEGVVAKPVVELRTRRGDRVITKIKTVDFV